MSRRPHNADTKRTVRRPLQVPVVPTVVNTRTLLWPRQPKHTCTRQLPPLHASPNVSNEFPERIDRQTEATEPAQLRYQRPLIVSDVSVANALRNIKHLYLRRPLFAPMNAQQTALTSAPESSGICHAHIRKSGDSTKSTRLQYADKCGRQPFVPLRSFSVRPYKKPPVAAHLHFAYVQHHIPCWYRVEEFEWCSDKGNGDPHQARLRGGLLRCGRPD